MQPLQRLYRLLDNPVLLMHVIHRVYLLLLERPRQTLEETVRVLRPAFHLDHRVLVFPDFDTRRQPRRFYLQRIDNLPGSLLQALLPQGIHIREQPLHVPGLLAQNPPDRVHFFRQRRILHNLPRLHRPQAVYRRIQARMVAVIIIRLESLHIRTSISLALVQLVQNLAHIVNILPSHLHLERLERKTRPQLPVNENPSRQRNEEHQDETQHQALAESFSRLGLFARRIFHRPPTAS